MGSVMYSHLTDQIDAIIGDTAGGGLAACEDMLHRIEWLDEDQRSALWLYGWHQLPDGQARDEVLALLDLSFA